AHPLLLQVAAPPPARPVHHRRVHGRLAVPLGDRGPRPRDGRHQAARPDRPRHPLHRPGVRRPAQVPRRAQDRRRGLHADRAAPPLPVGAAAREPGQVPQRQDDRLGPGGAAQRRPLELHAAAHRDAAQPDQAPPPQARHVRRPQPQRLGRHRPQGVAHQGGARSARDGLFGQAGQAQGRV
ncbi:hypothetical protein VTH06DRAFT_3055, partial [Thermothelomyces fergusii]